MVRTQIDADIDRMEVRQEGALLTVDIPDRLEPGNGVLLDLDTSQMDKFVRKLQVYWRVKRLENEKRKQ